MLKEPQGCAVKYFIIRPSEIHFLRFTLEAYEGICGVTTLDSELGLVQLKIAPGCEDFVDDILEAEKGQMQLRAADFDPALLSSCPSCRMPGPTANLHEK